MTRKAARAAADAPVGPRPRLDSEITPSSLHHKSPRQILGKAWWNRTRKHAYAAADNRCEICGGTGDRHPAEAHEAYFHDELASPPVQHVIRLIALCPACHAVKHLYRIHEVSRERGRRRKALALMMIAPPIRAASYCSAAPRRGAVITSCCRANLPLSSCFAKHGRFGATSAP